MMFCMLVAEDGGENRPMGAIADFTPYGTCVPYTSPLALAYGLKACAWTSPEIEYPSFMEVDPFELSEMLGLMEQDGLESLLFDPPADVDGKLKIVGHSIPVGEYRSAIEVIRPEFGKLSLEAYEEFRRPSHLERRPYMRWPGADAEDIAADLRARIEELLDRDGR